MSSVVSLLTLPPLYWYISRTLAARKLEKTGIGKGAPGFLTGVKRVAVPPEIVARLRRGEDVSPEEIEAAQKAAAARSQQATTEHAPQPTPSNAVVTPADESNEWLPDNIKATPTRKTKGRRK
jgi:hypothetical protein